MQTTAEQVADKRMAEKIVQGVSVSGGITFDVSNVKISNEVFHTVKMKKAVERTVGQPVESCDNYSADVVEHHSQNCLMEACDAAFSRHVPLILSPDTIWLTIAQGLAKHVENNAEQLRHHFVKHEGKELIEVRRDDFIRLSPENPWMEVWPEFSGKIKEKIGDEIHDLIISNFSTTGQVEMAASQITLMDSMSSYFEYGFSTMCGIPKVTVQGTREDWTKILDKVNAIEKFGLEWWCPTLRTIVGEFVNVFDDKVNTEHWKALYKKEDSSGGPYINGWMARLYPYVRSVEYERDPQTYRTLNVTVHHKKKNRLIEKPWMEKVCDHEWGDGGISSEHIPTSFSQIPFWWQYFSNRYDYEFIGGIMAVEQLRGLVSGVRPRIGWAVREKKAA